MRSEKRGETDTVLGDYMGPPSRFFLPQNGVMRILVSLRKSVTVPPRTNHIRKAQTGETKCALGGSVSMDKNNKRV